MVYDRNLRASHCLAPLAWKSIWTDPKGKSWYLEACGGHAPKWSRLSADRPVSITRAVRSSPVGGRFFPCPNGLRLRAGRESLNGLLFWLFTLRLVPRAFGERGNTNADGLVPGHGSDRTAPLMLLDATTPSFSFATADTQVLLRPPGRSDSKPVGGVVKEQRPLTPVLAVSGKTKGHPPGRRGWPA
jgi:hypothetical protein